MSWSKSRNGSLYANSRGFGMSKMQMSSFKNRVGLWLIGVLVLCVQSNFRNNQTAAWPVANPVFTCASVTDVNSPSNFVADPFLYIQVRSYSLWSPCLSFVAGGNGQAAWFFRQYCIGAHDRKVHTSWPQCHRGTSFQLPTARVLESGSFAKEALDSLTSYVTNLQQSRCRN